MAQRFKNGKRVEQFSMLVSTVTCACEVYMVHELHGIHFMGVCDRHGVEVKSGDVNQMRKLLAAALRERLEIRWESKLHVELKLPLPLNEEDPLAWRHN